MKKITLLFFTIFLFFSLTFAQIPCDDIIIGNGTELSYEIPLNTFYNYSYTQQIYDADELEDLTAGMQIYFIAFYKDVSCEYSKHNQTIYLGNTTKTTFANTSDWVPISELMLVFSGSIIFSEDDQWIIIELQEPFIYTGGNVVVAMLNNDGTYLLCGNLNGKFKYHTVENKTLHYKTDAGAINPADMPAATGIHAGRNNIIFNYCEDPIFPEYPLNPNNIIGEGATITLVPDPIPYGENGTVYFSTAKGCRYIADVIIAGEHYGQIDSYEFVNVTAPLPVIEVVTDDYQYEITLISYFDGNMEDFGSSFFDCGTNATIQYVPSDCYEIEKVLMDGVEDEGSAQNGYFTFENITDNHTLEVFFKTMTFEIVASATPNGSINQQGVFDVNCGDNITFTITPDEGYKISSVLVNGVDEGALETYTFTTVTSNRTIEASFIPKLNIADQTIESISVYSVFNIIYIIHENNISISDVAVFDMYGRTVWQGQPQGNRIVLDVANGIYTVCITANNNFSTSKVNIQR